MRKLTMGCVFLLAVVAINVTNSSGHPWISNRFKRAYLPPNQADAPETPLEAQVDVADCFVCHDGAFKGQKGWQENRNAYGEALADVLGDNDALVARYRDRAAREQLFADIDTAIRQVAGQDSGDGRTYGAILENNELPVPLPEGFGEDDAE